MNVKISIVKSIDCYGSGNYIMGLLKCQQGISITIEIGCRINSSVLSLNPIVLTY